MRGITLLLDARHAERVESIWRMLEERFGLRGAFAGAPPHCSFHVAERYDDGVRDALAGLAARWRPVTVRVEGIGIFPGPRPIVSLAIARGPVLAEMQREVYHLVDPLAGGVDPHLAPDRWMPHITLTRDPVAPELLADVIECLGEQDYQWRFATNRLALLETGDPPTTHFQLSFSGSWGE